MYKRNLTHVKQNLTEEDLLDLDVCLIPLMDIVGMRDITEENLGELYARIRVYELLVGPSMHQRIATSLKPEPKYWTIAMLQRFIGLNTNMTEASRHKFVQMIGRIMDKMSKEKE